MAPLICLASVLLISAEFTFSGGDAYDLAKAVSTWSHKPVVVASPSSTKLPPLLVSGKTEAEVLQRIACTYGLIHAGGGTASFSPPAWPESQLWWQDWPSAAAEDAQGPTWDYKGLERVDGKLSIKPPRDVTFRVEAMPGGLFTKPVKSHWLYEGIPFLMYGEATDEESLFRTLSYAVGAKAEVREKEYSLNFDPKAFRTRASATLKAKTFRPGEQLYAYKLAHRDLLLRVFEVVSDADMEKLYATPKSYLLLDVPASSALASVAHAKFKAFFKDLGDNPGVHVKVEQLDEQAPLRVLVRARGGAFVQVRDKDGKTYHHF